LAWILPVLTPFFDLLFRYHTGIISSVSLVMVVKYDCCNRDFLIDHKFAMVLKSGDIPGQSNTYNLLSENRFHFFR